ncbi:MAG: hypothetical protein K940chlam7_01581 [Chlamydiae bacterium]|nr:hypothetical protein [Chlamydiota bacterium]
MESTPPPGPPQKPPKSDYPEYSPTPPLDPPVPKDDEVTIGLESDLRQLRLQKLKPLKPGHHQNVLDLENDLNIYEERFLSLRQSFLLSRQNKDDRKLKIQYLKQEHELRQLGDRLFTTYPQLDLSRVDFNSLSNPESTYADFVCKRAIILNTAVSKLSFLANLDVFLGANQERIMQEFQRVGLLGRNYQPTDVVDVHFAYIQKDAEKHNRGKVAVLVRFTFKNNSQFKFVCKPRDALLDQSVIDLFKQINQLPLSQKSSPHLLCEYTIISPSRKEGWKIDADLGLISLWEFIDGRRSKRGRSAANCIRLEIDNEPMQKVMLEKLDYLDAILTQLHISDLHCENVLFRGLDGPNPEIFPIDLENIQWEGETQLEGRPERIHLASEEMRCIEALKREIENLVIRILLLNTLNLLALGSYNTCELLTLKCIENLDNQGFILTTPKKELKQLLLKDILNSDVPYLTEFQNMLYFGMPYQRNIIGRKKNV